MLEVLSDTSLAFAPSSADATSLGALANAEFDSVWDRMEAEAAHPDAPAWKLHAYAEYPILRPAVLRNPSVPPALIFKHGAFHPDAVANNPALPLLLTTDIAFLEKFVMVPQGRNEKGVFESLLDSHSCPVGVFRIALQHPTPTRARSILANPMTPPDVLVGLEDVVRHKRVSVLRIRDVKAHPNHPSHLKRSPREVLEKEVVRLANDLPSLPQAGEAFRLFHLPRWVEALMLQEYPHELAYLTASPRVLEELARDATETVAQSIVANPHAPTQLLSLLARRFRAQIEKQVNNSAFMSTRFAAAFATNPRTPPDLLAWLAEHARERTVVHGLLHNPAATPFLGPFAIDRSSAGILLGNEGAHEDLLRTAYRNAFPSERTTLARNPNAPSGLLEALFAERIELYAYSDAITNVLDHPNTPRSCFEKAVEHDEADVRAAAAASIRTPLDLLAVLQADPETSVRRHLVKNPTVPSAWLEQYRVDPSDAVRSLVAKREKNVLEPDTPSQVAPRDHDHQLLLAMSADVSEEAARFLAEAPYAWVRLALALNPDVSGEVRSRLRADANEVVAAAASGPPPHDPSSES